MALNFKAQDLASSFLHAYSEKDRRFAYEGIIVGDDYVLSVADVILEQASKPFAVSLVQCCIDFIKDVEVIGFELLDCEYEAQGCEGSFSA